MIKLVVTDLDLTIVHRDGSISERVQQALAACRAAGLGLCVATGRVRQGTLQIGQDYTICHGGTLVMLGEEMLLRSAVDVPRVASLWQWAKEREVPGVFFGEHAWAATHRGDDVASLTQFLRCEPEPEPMWDVPLARFKASEAELAEAFPDLHIEPEGNWTYVRREAADKGTALRLLMSHLGLSPDEVICFGDELNDVSMFQVAGHAVAVGNARSELKELATRIAPPIEEDGVALVLEEILAGSVG